MSCVGFTGFLFSRGRLSGKTRTRMKVSCESGVRDWCYVLWNEKLTCFKQYTASETLRYDQEIMWLPPLGDRIERRFCWVLGRPLADYSGSSIRKRRIIFSSFFANKSKFHRGRSTKIRRVIETCCNVAGRSLTDFQRQFFGRNRFTLILRLRVHLIEIILRRAKIVVCLVFICWWVTFLFLLFCEYCFENFNSDSKSPSRRSRLSFGPLNVPPSSCCTDDDGKRRSPNTGSRVNFIRPYFLLCSLSFGVPVVSSVGGTARRAGNNFTWVGRTRIITVILCGGLNPMAVCVWYATPDVMCVYHFSSVPVAYSRNIVCQT